jgi:glycosyltransferase involved in cell wall biosynthesis
MELTTETFNRQREIADPSVMAKTPLVSVKMITYNHAPYLAEAIEGVITQDTDFPFELVISEDCSTDNSRAIALDYQRRYPEIIRVLVSDSNVGMMANGRRALKACRGEFIAYCEGDDYWIDHQKLAKQVAVLSRLKDIDICFHSCYIKYEKQQKKELSAVRSHTDQVFDLSTVIIGGGSFMPTASLLVRRSALLSAQDWIDAESPPVGDYFIQVFGAQKGGAYYINEPMCVYRTDVAGSWTETNKQTDASDAFEKSFFVALKKLQQVCPGQEDAFRHHLINKYADDLASASNENFIRLKAVILPFVRSLYPPEAVDGLPEGEVFLKLAVDRGRMKDLEEPACGWPRQGLRVAKSGLAYGLLVLGMLAKNCFYASERERTVAKWRVKAQRAYLSARGERLCGLLCRSGGTCKSCKPG